MNVIDKIETAVNVAGVGVGISMIKDILGVVILSLNAVILLIKGVLWIIKWWKKASKDGKITEDEIQELMAGAEEAKKYIEELNEDVQEEK